MMKDIMQKLAELEATAPKVTKKKMLNEDSTTPPMNVSNKPASLKDVFATLSENIAPGQKPLPVLDPQKKQAGMGFVTSDNPAVQNMLKNLDPKDVQIMQAPGQPGQPQAGQQQQTVQSGQPNQMQAGQQAMQEESPAGGSKEDLAKEMYFVASKIINYENRSATVPQTLWQQYEKLRATWEQSYGQLGKDVINDAFHLGEYVHWVKDIGAQQKTEAGDKLTYQVRPGQGGKWIIFNTTFNKPWDEYANENKAKIIAAKLNSTDPNYSKLQAAANAAPAQPQQKSFMGRMADKAKQAVGMKEEQLDELSPDLLNRAAGKSYQKMKDINPHGDPAQRLERSVPKYVPGLGNSQEYVDARPPGIQFWDKKRQKFRAGAEKARLRDYDKAQYAKQTQGMSPAQQRQYDAMMKSGDIRDREHLDELSPELLGRASEKAFNQEMDFKNKAYDRRQTVRQYDGYGGSNMVPDPNSPLGKAAAAKNMQSAKFQDAAVKAASRDQEREDLKDLSPAMKRKLGMSEGAKVDRMVKHIEKSEKKSGKSKGEAEDIAWATANKRGMLDNKNKKKVKEGDIAPTSSIDTRGAGLGAGRNPKFTEGKKPDFLDLDKDGNKKEPMKKAAADKNKKKVKESMNHRISAARLEGKSHGLRGHAHSGKRYEDMSEMKAYHEGYKEGLDECYGQGVYETAPAATVPGMATQALDELSPATLGSYAGKASASMHDLGQDEAYYREPGRQAFGGAAATRAADKLRGKAERRHQGINQAIGKLTQPAMEDDMEEGNAFTLGLANAKKGEKFSVGGKTFTDRTDYDAKVNEYAFESLDQQLNALLNESEEVTEGLSVSISKGQQNSPDSVTITAQDQEAEHLLAFVKNAGLGLFGDDNADAHSSAMSVQPSHGAPDEVGAGGIDIGVVDGHDGMMGLMQKLSGIQAGGAEDYADEEGDEEQLYGNHETADKKDCGCDGDCECSDYDKPSNEGTCNECGGMMEAGHSCGSKEMVDEVESEDQMEFEVAEDNAPDSGEAESTADEDAEAKEDAALAGADSGDEEEMNEGSGDEPKHRNSDDKDDKDFDDEEKVSESSAFASLFKKLSIISEEATDKEDEKAEKAGKKVTKDIEYDDKKDKKGMSDKQAKFFGKKADKEKVDEWANNAGPGKTVSDTTFEQDIDFMTNVISGGLNKQKSTGQTTVPIIAGQEDRIHDESTNTPANFAKLAGIK